MLIMLAEDNLIRKQQSSYWWWENVILFQVSEGIGTDKLVSPCRKVRRSPLIIPKYWPITLTSCHILLRYHLSFQLYSIHGTHLFSLFGNKNRIESPYYQHHLLHQWCTIKQLRLHAFPSLEREASRRVCSSASPFYVVPSSSSSSISFIFWVIIIQIIQLTIKHWCRSVYIFHSPWMPYSYPNSRYFNNDSADRIV